MKNQKLKKIESSPIPRWKIGWGFSYACNMNCKFCYSKQILKETIGTPFNINPHLDFIRNNEAQIESINWGTSENSLSRSWFELIKKLNVIAPEIVQGVTTNGFLGCRCLEDKNFLNIFITCIKDVDVSLDFAEPVKHNEFRGNNSAYEWAIKTLELCHEYDIPRSIVLLGCKETLTKDNICGLFNLARKYGSNLRINIFRPVRGTNLDTIGYLQLKEVLIYIIKKYNIISLGDPLFAALLGSFVQDPSGNRSLRILPDGSLTPSTYLIESPWIAANILNSTVNINDLPHTRQFQQLSSNVIPVECKECRLVTACLGGCKDRRIIWFKTLKTRDPYCPMRFDKDLDWLKDFPLRFSEARGPLIHEGYLPTLIFRP